MDRISAVVITKNEEINIGLCIEALQQVADEIIIVDSFSTDNTEKICLSYNVQFYRQEWQGYGRQKNFGIDKSAYNIIIAMDADEILTPDAINAINKLKQSGFKGVYSIRRVNWFFGKFIQHGLEAPSYCPRLFDKALVRWNDDAVHEKLEIPDGTALLKIKADASHYSYRSIEQFAYKSNLYTSLGAQQLYDRGKRSYMLKLLLSPAFTFIKAYVIKAGFLEGMHGLVLARLNAQANFMKYAKLRQLCLYGRL